MSRAKQPDVCAASAVYVPDCKITAEDAYALAEEAKECCEDTKETLAEHDTRLGTLETWEAEAKGQIEDHDSRLDALETWETGAKDQLTESDTRLDALEAWEGEAREQITESDTRLDALETWEGEAEGQLSGLETWKGTAEGQIEDHDTRLDALESWETEAKGQISEQDTRLDTLESEEAKAQHYGGFTAGRDNVANGKWYKFLSLTCTDGIAYSITIKVSPEWELANLDALGTLNIRVDGDSDGIIDYVYMMFETLGSQLQPSYFAYAYTQGSQTIDFYYKKDMTHHQTIFSAVSEYHNDQFFPKNFVFVNDTVGIEALPDDAVTGTAMCQKLNADMFLTPEQYSALLALLGGQ